MSSERIKNNFGFRLKLISSLFLLMPRNSLCSIIYIGKIVFDDFHGLSLLLVVVLFLYLSPRKVIFSFFLPTIKVYLPTCLSLKLRN